MRKLITILFVIIGQVSFGQVYQIMPQYGYSAPRFNTDSTLQLPTFNGTPTLKSNKTNKGAIAIDSTNGRFYFYNPKTSAWSQVSGGGGSTDTTSLSNRIDSKLAIVDTTNKFVSNITKFNDSTITIFKGITQTNITLSSTINAKRLITEVYNNTGSTITKGSVIYINGRHSSNLPTIALAQANTEVNSYSTFALVQNDITTSNSGIVVQAGTITDLNLPTSSYTDGQIVYLSPTIPGGITTTKPLAPYHIVKIGTITRAHPTLGTIELKIENGWQLDELSDVQLATTPADSTLLFFTRTDSLWKAVTPLNVIGNRYLKPSDSTIYYTKYRSDSSRTNIYSGINTKLAKSDTSTLSARIDLKLNISDTSNMLSKYLRKTDTATLSNRINLKLNIADTNTMLNPYLRKSDTSTLSTRINNKLAITDTSTLQSKSLASYTFQANNTTATANATANTFKDTSGTYTGTPTWSGGTAPTTLTNAVFSYTQVGKVVTLRITMIYTNQGSSNTRIAIPLMATMPTPIAPSGYTSTSDIFGFGAGYFGNVITSIVAGTTGSSVCYIKGTATGYEVVVDRGTSGSGKYVWATISYFTN